MEDVIIMKVVGSLGGTRQRLLDKVVQLLLWAMESQAGKEVCVRFSGYENRLFVNPANLFQTLTMKM